MTRAVGLLGVTFPIVQAPIGSASTAKLAAAVSNTGGLGMLAGTWRSPDALRDLIQRTRALTQRPFGVNLVLAFDVAEQLRASPDAGVRIISFFWGDPAPWVSTVHQAGGIVLHTAGSVQEAADAASAGVDMLVAQGVEAGGHVRGTAPLQQLLPDIRRAVPVVPVLAAGGIGDVDSRGPRPRGRRRWDLARQPFRRERRSGERIRITNSAWWTPHRAIPYSAPSSTSAGPMRHTGRSGTRPSAPGKPRAGHRGEPPR